MTYYKIIYANVYIQRGTKKVPLSWIFLYHRRIFKMVCPKYPAYLVLKMIVRPGWTAIILDQTQTLNKKFSAFNYTMGYYT